MMENSGYQITGFIRSEVDPDSGCSRRKRENSKNILAAAKRLNKWKYDVEEVLATE